MTYHKSELTLPVEFLEEIAEQGFDALPELIRIVTPALAVRCKCERGDADGAAEIPRRCTLRTIVKAAGSGEWLQTAHGAHACRRDHLGRATGAGRRLLSASLGEGPAQRTSPDSVAGRYVPRKEMQAEVAADTPGGTIFNAPDRATADQYLARMVQKYAKTASKLADWLEKNIPEGLTVFAFPAAHQRRLRTTNGVERLNREIDRRTTVVSIFPNEAACLRLISAILVEIDEAWQTDKKYLSFPPSATSS